MQIWFKTNANFKFIFIDAEFSEKGRNAAVLAIENVLSTSGANSGKSTVKLFRKNAGGMQNGLNEIFL